MQLVKTHDLIKLNEMINEITNIGIDEKNLIKINEVYIETRYPVELGLIPDGMPTNEDAKEFLVNAKKIKSIIINALE